MTLAKLALTGAVFALGLWSAGPAGAASTRIPVDELTHVVGNAFKGLSLRLHNYSRNRRGKGWHRRGGSSIGLPKPIGGGGARFMLAVVSKGGIRYYLNDIKLKRIEIGSEGVAIRVRLRFETEGTELVGRCRTKARCRFGTNRAAPNGELAPASHIDLFVVPGEYKGGVSIEHVQIRVSFTYDPALYCKGRPAPCNAKSDYDAMVARTLRARFRALLMRPAMRARFARLFRPVLDRHGVGRVTGARLTGRVFTVRHVPR